MLIIPNPNRLPIANRFQEWSSSSFGGAGPLYWTLDPRSKYDLSALTRIQRAHRRALRVKGFLGLWLEHGYSSDGKTVVPTTVNAVMPDSPIASTDIRKGDVIKSVKIDERHFRDPEDVYSAIAEVRASVNLCLSIDRKGKHHAVSHAVRSFADVLGV